MVRYLLAGALICVVVLSLSCCADRHADMDSESVLASSGLMPPEERKCAERGNADEAVAYMMTAYEREHVAAYASALDDEFRFHFLPEVAESIGLPPGEPWWGKVNDVSSSENMFGAPSVTDINASLVRLTEWMACTDPVTGRDGMCARFEPDIVITIEESGGEPILLWVNQTWVDVIAVPDQHEPGLWCVLALIEIEKSPGILADARGRTLATEGTSWGNVKAMFK